MVIIRHTRDCTREGIYLYIYIYIYIYIYKIPIFETVIIFSLHIDDTFFVSYI